MEWLDNLREELAWPYVQARNWLENEDNRTAVFIIALITAVVAFFLYFGVFFGGRAAVSALKEETMITVVSGNPCLTNKGLVKAYAPPPCYEDKLSHPPKFPTTSSPAETVLNGSKPESAPVYDPPCFKPGCSDQIYSKRLVEGEIYTATFNSDKRLTDDDHLQPDYTSVEFLGLGDDEERPNPEKFCGNVLDHFTPGKKFRMVINESKQADYNNCYTIDPTVQLTFGGDTLRATRRTRP